VWVLRLGIDHLSHDVSQDLLDLVVREVLLGCIHALPGAGLLFRRRRSNLHNTLHSHAHGQLLHSWEVTWDLNILELTARAVKGDVGKPKALEDLDAAKVATAIPRVWEPVRAAAAEPGLLLHVADAQGHEGVLRRGLALHRVQPHLHQQDCRKASAAEG